ncbi:Kinesin heavy chain [Diplonema papillatum]|nr:Kinesin heavy chain [Diplonema papillatum]
MDELRGGRVNLKVYVRVRPLLDGEDSPNDDDVGVECVGVKGVRVRGDPVREFDHVFRPSTTQEEVYNRVGRRGIDHVVAGYHSTIFLYGQTGSGKTHTAGVTCSSQITLKCGVMPRCIDGIFAIVAGDPHHEYRVIVEWIQIYQDTVQDLLASSPSASPLQIRECPDNGVFLVGGQSVSLSQPSDFVELARKAEKSRVTALTRMNATSSRSHSCMMITVAKRKALTMMDHVDGKSLRARHSTKGRLCIVDLAGSERLKKSGSEGIRKEEAKRINSSLAALGNVLQALVDRKPHVPYRDSKLTRLLQDSLGGTGVAAFIVTISPCSRHLLESKNTLLFAERAREVRNAPIIHREADAGAQFAELQAALEDRIAILEAANRRLEASLLAKAPHQSSSDEADSDDEGEEGGEGKLKRKVRSLYALLRQREYDLQVLKSERSDADSRYEVQIHELRETVAERDSAVVSLRREGKAAENEVKCLQREIVKQTDAAAALQNELRVARQPRKSGGAGTEPGAGKLKDELAACQRKAQLAEEELRLLRAQQMTFDEVRSGLEAVIEEQRETVETCTKELAQREEDVRSHREQAETAAQAAACQQNAAARFQQQLEEAGVREKELRILSETLAARAHAAESQAVSDREAAARHLSALSALQEANDACEKEVRRLRGEMVDTRKLSETERLVAAERDEAAGVERLAQAAACASLRLEGEDLRVRCSSLQVQLDDMRTVVEKREADLREQRLHFTTRETELAAREAASRRSAEESVVLELWADEEASRVALELDRSEALLRLRAEQAALQAPIIAQGLAWKVDVFRLKEERAVLEFREAASARGSEMATAEADALHSENRALQNMVKALEATTRTVEGTRQRLEVRCREADNAVASLRSQLSSETTRAQALQLEKEHLLEHAADAKNRIQDLIHDLETASTSYEALEASKDTLLRRIDEKDRELAAVRDCAKEVEQREDGLRKELASVEGERCELSAQLQAFREQLYTADADRAEQAVQQVELEHQKSRVEELEHELKVASRCAEATADEITGLSQQLQQCMTDKVRLQKEVADSVQLATSREAEHKAQSSKLVRKAEELAQKLSAAKAECADAAKGLEDSFRQREELEEEVTQLREEGGNGKHHLKKAMSALKAAREEGQAVSDNLLAAQLRIEALGKERAQQNLELAAATSSSQAHFAATVSLRKELAEFKDKLAASEQSGDHSRALSSHNIELSVKLSTLQLSFLAAQTALGSKTIELNYSTGVIALLRDVTWRLALEVQREATQREVACDAAQGLASDQQEMQDKIHAAEEQAEISRQASTRASALLQKALKEVGAKSAAIAALQQDLVFEREELHAQLKGKDEALAALKQQLEQLTSSLEAERNALSTQVSGICAEKEEQITRLQEDADRRTSVLRTESHTAKEQTVRAEREAEALLARNAELEARAADAAAKAAQLDAKDADFAALAERCSRREEQLTRCASEKAALRSEADELALRLQAAEARVADFAALTEQCARSTSEKAALRLEADELALQLQAAEAKAADFVVLAEQCARGREQLARSTSEKAALRMEADELALRLRAAEARAADAVEATAQQQKRLAEDRKERESILQEALDSERRARHELDGTRAALAAQLRQAEQRLAALQAECASDGARRDARESALEGHLQQSGSALAVAARERLWTQAEAAAMRVQLDRSSWLGLVARNERAEHAALVERSAVEQARVRLDRCEAEKWALASEAKELRERLAAEVEQSGRVTAEANAQGEQARCLREEVGRLHSLALQAEQATQKAAAESASRAESLQVEIGRQRSGHNAALADKQRELQRASTLFCEEHARLVLKVEEAAGRCDAGLLLRAKEVHKLMRQMGRVSAQALNDVRGCEALVRAALTEEQAAAFSRIAAIRRWTETVDGLGTKLAVQQRTTSAVRKQAAATQDEVTALRVELAAVSQSRRAVLAGCDELRTACDRRSTDVLVAGEGSARHAIIALWAVDLIRVARTESSLSAQAEVAVSGMRTRVKQLEDEASRLETEGDRLRLALEAQTSEARMARQIRSESDCRRHLRHSIENVHGFEGAARSLIVSSEADSRDTVRTQFVESSFHSTSILAGREDRQRGAIQLEAFDMARASSMQFANFICKAMHHESTRLQMQAITTAESAQRKDFDLESTRAVNAMVSAFAAEIVRGSRWGPDREDIARELASKGRRGSAGSAADPEDLALLQEKLAAAQERAGAFVQRYKRARRHRNACLGLLDRFGATADLFAAGISARCDLLAAAVKLPLDANASVGLSDPAPLHHCLTCGASSGGEFDGTPKARVDPSMRLGLGSDTSRRERSSEPTPATVAARRPRYYDACPSIGHSEYWQSSPSASNGEPSLGASLKREGRQLAEYPDCGADPIKGPSTLASPGSTSSESCPTMAGAAGRNPRHALDASRAAAAGLDDPVPASCPSSPEGARLLGETRPRKRVRGGTPPSPHSTVEKARSAALRQRAAADLSPPAYGTPGAKGSEGSGKAAVGEPAARCAGDGERKAAALARPAPDGKRGASRKAAPAASPAQGDHTPEAEAAPPRSRAAELAGVAAAAAAALSGPAGAVGTPPAAGGRAAPRGGSAPPTIAAEQPRPRGDSPTAAAAAAAPALGSPRCEHLTPADPASSQAAPALGDEFCPRSLFADALPVPGLPPPGTPSQAGGGSADGRLAGWERQVANDASLGAPTCSACGDALRVVIEFYNRKLLEARGLQAEIVARADVQLENERALADKKRRRLQAAVAELRLRHRGWAPADADDTDAAVEALGPGSEPVQVHGLRRDIAVSAARDWKQHFKADK